jgi:hypothetical protein
VLEAGDEYAGHLSLHGSCCDETSGTAAPQPLSRRLFPPRSADAGARWGRAPYIGHRGSREAAERENVPETRRHILWRYAPLLALAVALTSLAFGGLAQRPAAAAVLALLQLATLAIAVFAAVHHADVIAHRTGEPYGTLVLTAAVTIIEVALILSIMLAGDGSATLARDTVLAVLMIVVNGLVGVCLIVGGLRYGEQGFRLPVRAHTSSC